jgi:hypothetical protein
MEYHDYLKHIKPPLQVVVLDLTIQITRAVNMGRADTPLLLDYVDPK